MKNAIQLSGYIESAIPLVNHYLNTGEQPQDSLLSVSTRGSEWTLSCFAKGCPVIGATGIWFENKKPTCRIGANVYGPDGLKIR